LLLLDMHGADYLFCWVLAHCRESIEYLFSPNMSQVLLVADAFIVAKTFFFWKLARGKSWKCCIHFDE
jgi:hypothetical protein